MIATLEIARTDLKDILTGLKDISTVEDSSFEDFNIISLSHANLVKIYVRHHDLYQVVHTISNEGGITLDVEEDNEMVFNPDVITSLIKESKADRLNLRFSTDQFSIETQDGWFSTPTTFTLNLFQESEFQSPISVSNFNKICSVKREELINSLSMMSIVSTVVKFSLTGDEFWISVEDAVHGSGQVMESVDPADIELDDFEYKYKIEILQSFLESVSADLVEISVNAQGSLRMKTEESGHQAELMLAERLDRP